ncbi:MAG TPA: glycosyltransferase family 39 protein [Methylomirabilota bacterium]|nr:glycosyltransferase family 39 protein [Methylomirabilota bacterium]
MTDRLARSLALLALAGGIILRFIQLGADPYYYEWNGYVTDEGRWIAHARALILFGDIRAGGPALHLLLAPLFQAAELVVFAAAGVSLWSARLVSVVAGSVLLVAFWVVYRRLATPAAVLLALAMLAVEMDLVALSRLAIPEMTAMILSFIAFVLLVNATTTKRLFLAGVVTAAAIGAKLTVLPLAVIFGVVAVTRGPEAGVSRRRALGAYAAVLLVSAALATGAVLLAGALGALPLRVLLRVAGDFVGVSELYALVAFPFDDTLAPVLALWGLVAWLGSLGGLVKDAAGAPADARSHLRAAWIWVALFAPLMFLSEYFPSRYKLHILVPLAVIIAVGVSRLQRAGVAALAAALVGVSGARRAAAALLLSAPTALIAAAAALSVVGALGVDPQRMRVRYVVILLSVTLVSGWAVRAMGRIRATRFLVALPTLWMLAWLVVERSSVAGAPFWPAPGDAETVRWALIIGAGVAAALAASVGSWPRDTGGRALVGAALLFVLLGVARLAPGYVDPHYSMRDSSRDLGALLGGARGPIRSIGGEALFSDNRLRYASILGGYWPPTPPEVLIVAGAFPDPEDRLNREYRLIRQYAIYVAPEFVLGEAGWKPSHGQFQRTNVRVYRRGG